MLRRTFTHREIEFEVVLNAVLGRRYRWRFELPFGATGEGGPVVGIEPAFVDGEWAGKHAIDAELDG